jgi:long-chain acyl-CoA synthetase
LTHYDEGVPASLAPYPNRTLLDYLSDAALEEPRASAMLFKGARVSYGDLERLSDAAAAALASLGVKRGDRVGLLLPNCPQFLIAQFGVWKLGAIVAPLNPIYSERELEVPLREHGIETVVVLTRYYERLKRVQPLTPVRRVIATNIKEYFPIALRSLFTLFAERRGGDRIAIRPGDHDFAHLLLLSRGRRVERSKLAPHDPAVLLLSGGTTGTPKGVLGTHGAYVMAGLQVVAWVSSAIQGERRPVFIPLPLFHVYCNAGVQPLALIGRLPMALIPNPRDMADLLTTLRRVKPSFFNGVPTLYTALLERKEVREHKIDFKSIRICVSGASALLAETKNRFESITGGRIVEAYSLTEAMMAVCANPVKGPGKPGSVGMPLPDVHVRIFDAEEGVRALNVNEVGEIAISAPQLMVGYWNRPDETAEVLRDHVDQRGTRRWLHTGDLGYMDDDGYVFIVDRKKDLIKTSGYQVWPREIEEVLASHRAVADVGVAGVGDPAKGETVKAWVVLREGCSVSEAELRTYCRQQLAPYKVPTTIEFRKELPKNMIGKVLRRSLREEEQTGKK